MTGSPLLVPNRIVTLEEAQRLEGEDRFAAYGALDATGTLEIFSILRPRLNEDQERTYRWSIAQMSPALAMARRGVRVNPLAHDKAIREAKKDLAEGIRNVRSMALVTQHWDGQEMETGLCPLRDPPRLGKKGQLLKHQPGNKPQHHKWSEAESELDRVCLRCGTKRFKPSPFSPTSPDQVKHLLYDILQVPIRTDKEGSITTNKEALQSIQNEPVAYRTQGTGRRVKSPLEGLRELVTTLLVVKDLQKQVGFLSAPMPGWRYYSSFNVNAAWSGRFSSSANPFGHGGNLQNISEKHRHMFEADPGHELFYADLKTAESLKVAYSAGDESYIEAHKGDVHTWVCREVWPELPWTGDIKVDKKIAQTHIPAWDNQPGHDFRFQSKRIQHGSNYGLTPYGISRIGHIPLEVAMQAQGRYFKTFPMIPEWHRYVIERVRNQLPLYNALRRMVRLFGRPLDRHTHNQGLAFGPQSGVADILDIGMWNVWHETDPWLIQLLAQVHDALLGQFLRERRGEATQALHRLLRTPVEVTDFRGTTRTMTIDVEVAVGLNWGKRSPTNPEGIEEVKL